MWFYDHESICDISWPMISYQIKGWFYVYEEFREIIMIPEIMYTKVSDVFLENPRRKMLRFQYTCSQWPHSTLEPSFILDLSCMRLRRQTVPVTRNRDLLIFSLPQASLAQLLSARARPQTGAALWAFRTEVMPGRLDSSLRIVNIKTFCLEKPSAL